MIEDDDHLAGLSFCREMNIQPTFGSAGVDALTAGEICFRSLMGFVSSFAGHAAA